jgi:serine/threonine protein kinase
MSSAKEVKLPPNLKQTVVQGHTFTVDKRYDPRKLLGRGSFGVVCTALDADTGATIAVKRIRPYANDEWDARHTLREIRLMRLLGDHPNVISLYDLAVFDDKSEVYSYPKPKT